MIEFYRGLPKKSQLRPVRDVKHPINPKCCRRAGYAQHFQMYARKIENLCAFDSLPIAFTLFNESALRPIHSISRDVRPSVTP